MILHVDSNNNMFSADVNGIDVRSGTPVAYYSFEKGKTFMRLTPSTSGPTTYHVIGGFSDSTALVCDYYSEPDGSLTISLQKWMQIARTKPGIKYVVFHIQSTINLVADTLDLYLNVLPGISYNDLLAPRQKEIDNIYQGLMRRTVVPPNVMLHPESLGGLSIIAESSFGDISLFTNPIGTWQAVNFGGSTTPITPSGERGNEIEIGGKTEYIVYTDGNGNTRRWHIEYPDDCLDYAVLRWTSITGATRQHAFPIFAIENSVDDAVTLASLGDGFAVTKNVSNGFVIRLTGLTAYSVWYYNDMLNANDLHATVDGSGITTEQTLAMVEGNTMVMPQGGGFFTFEAKIKYRHYDTF